MAMSNAERQRLYVKRLKERAAAGEAAPVGPPGYSEPFPHVSCANGVGDVDSRKIIDWCERRIVSGEMSPAVLDAVARGVQDLAHIYWGRNGHKSARKPLDEKEKRERRAKINRKREAALAS